MISSYDLRERRTHYAISRAAKNLSNAEIMVGALAFPTESSLYMQILHIHRTEIVSMTDYDAFKNRPRIFPGLVLDDDLVQYLEVVSNNILDQIIRDLLVEAISLGIILSSLGDYYLQCFEVFTSPRDWTKIPDITRPFTQKR